jgi:hypothetical protein
MLPPAKGSVSAGTGVDQHPYYIPTMFSQRSPSCIDRPPVGTRGRELAELYFPRENSRQVPVDHFALATRSGMFDQPAQQFQRTDG